MKLWIKVVAGVVPGAVILLLSILVFLRLCGRRRQLPSNSTTPFTETEAKYTNDTFKSGISKLQLSYKSSSSASSIRFHHLHHAQQQPINLQQRPPFDWDDHPQLITEAVENGWSRFVFKSLFAASSITRSTRPLLRLYSVCVGGQRQDQTETDWVLPQGSSEFMQTVRLNPGPSRGSSNPDDSSSCSVIVRLSLPLPGPRLGSSSFPQEAYFEITILHLQPQHHQSSKASKRTKDREDDSSKLIQMNPIESPVQEFKPPKDEASKQSNPVISLGLTMGGSPPIRSMPGSYPGSIGFSSDGSVSLDGMKLVFGSERTEWGEVNRVIGCGYDPGKKKVFLTVDSEVLHVIRCNSDVYKSPLYPVLAVARADVMVLINLGQRDFKYAPANAHRTPNPCFVRPPSDDSGAAVFGHVDSRELFSMGRIDSELLDVVARKANTNSGSKRGNRSSNGDSFAVDIEGDSDLFEIALQSRGQSLRSEASIASNDAANK